VTADDKDDRDDVDAEVDVIAEELDESAADEIDDSAAEVTDSADEVDGQTPEDDTAPDEQPGSDRRGLKHLLVPIVLAAALLGSAGFATWAYLAQFRPDQQTSDAVAAATIKAASDGTIALLSYTPETLDKDFASAKTHLTGDFLNYYTQFTHDIVTPAAKDKAVKTTATVAQAGVAELKPDSAVVLVFINQNTTSKENPNGSFTASSVKVGLTKVNDDWLIKSFDPV
jgi:Mce-associated membrane protein